MKLGKKTSFLEVFSDRLLKQKNLTVADLAPDKLKKRASGDWKIGPKRLDDVEMVVVLYHGTIIAQFELSARVTYDRETHRSTLELIDYTGSNHLVGSTVDYETKNPATIKTINQFTENYRQKACDFSHGLSATYHQ